MTEKEKAKAYDEAIERAKKLYGNGIAEGIFPELKESDDDRIRKWIIDDIRYNMNNEPLNNSEYKKKAENAIAWLEKQGKNSTDKTKLSFNVGDWVVLITSKSVYQVEKKENYEYTLRHISGGSMCLPFSNDVLLREWTIEDARDGDVLSLYTEYKGNKITQIGIIEKYAGEYVGCSNMHTFKIYAGVNWANNLQIGKHMGCSDIHPATKEQRDLLFQKIKEAGYEWDADKKELKKSVGSKFNVGNWYQCTKDIFDKGVTFNKNTAYYCTKEGCLQDEYRCHIVIAKDLYDNFKLWTIQDANDGDILATWSGPFIYNGNNGGGSCPGSYCGINTLGNFQMGVEHHWTGKKVYPATKEQRDALMKAMKDAGYEWDSEKKELKKLEAKSNWED